MSDPGSSRRLLDNAVVFHAKEMDRVMIAWVRSVAATACIAVTGLLAPTAFCQDHQPFNQDHPDHQDHRLFHQDHRPRNLVVNGDFSADGGSLDGWTFNQNVDNFYWQPVVNGTTDYASNGCLGVVCITGAEEQKNYLYQTIRTIPGRLYV